MSDFGLVVFIDLNWGYGTQKKRVGTRFFIAFGSLYRCAMYIVIVPSCYRSPSVR